MGPLAAALAGLLSRHHCARRCDQICLSLARQESHRALERLDELLSWSTLEATEALAAYASQMVGDEREAHISEEDVPKLRRVAPVRAVAAAADHRLIRVRAEVAAVHVVPRRGQVEEGHELDPPPPSCSKCEWKKPAVNASASSWADASAGRAGRTVAKMLRRYPERNTKISKL